MRLRALHAATISLFLSIAAAPSSSFAIDDTLLVIRDCGVYLEPYSFNEGTIFRLLERDGLTRKKLYDRMTALDGTTSPHRYQTRGGISVVVKEGNDARKEVAAYQISRLVGLKSIPQTEGFLLGDRFYSAAKIIPTQKVTIEAPSGRIRTEKLESVCKNPVPDEMILRDSLIMNSDRLPGGHNYILHAKKLPTPYRRTDGPLVLADLDYIAIDHGGAFGDWKFDRWLMKYQRFVELSEDEFVAILRRNPDFIARLREWKTPEIRRELKRLLDPGELNAFLERRTVLLKLYEQGTG